MDNTLRCIIIDDEEGAHLVLEHHIKCLKHLQLIGAFFNAMEALEYIHTAQVDLIFLDINMPGLTGLQLLKTLSNPPLVILTTAYRQYALESYEYRVVDYLVKPFEFERFAAAIDNVFSRIKPRSIAPETSDAKLQESIILKVEGDIVRVACGDILYVQSWGNYVKVYLQDTVLLSPVTTTEIEQKLDGNHFRRIHKSYIVALKKVKRIFGGQVELDGGTILPVGSTYRRELIEALK